jgi:DNA-binding transcriptional ArsR family regulator
MFKHINKEATESNFSRDEFLEVLRALADETRQQIIVLASGREEVNVNEIAKNFSLSRPTISHHLNVMKRVKLLKMRKEGKEIFYSFNKSYVIGLLEAFVDNLKNCC